MTNEEAIKKLTEASFYECHEDCYKTPRDCKNCELMQAQDLAIDALEKQIPKKPQKHVGYCDSVFFKCDCNHEFDYNSPYCPHCGQAIDWSDSND